MNLTELRDGAEVAATVAAAVQVGLFQELREGGATAAELARRLGLDLRAVRVLTDALVDMDALTCTEGAYELVDWSRRLLGDPESADYAGDGLPLWLSNLRCWTRLPEALRSGEPVETGSRERTREELAQYLAGMAAAPAERVRRIVSSCLERTKNPRTALDVGGGPGHFASALRHQGLDVTLFDRPEVIDYVEEAYGLANVDHLHLVSGDFTEDPMPPGPFDIVLLSNITHIYRPDQNRDLLRKASQVLVPGGLVAVADFVRGWSSRAARFAIVMLLRTQDGNTYTEDEYRSWLQAAGFSDLVIEDADVDRQLITGRKTL